jgi:hypothetical protein
MSRIIITRVRMSEKAGLDALKRYVMSGRYGGVRVPRGVPAGAVFKFITKEINEDTETECFPRLVDVMRFYEPVAALPSLLRLLVAVPSRQSLPKAAAIAEIAGDIGDTKQADDADAYLESKIVPQPDAITISTPILSACVALNSIKGLGKFTRRLESERDRLDAGKNRDEQGLRDYAKVAAILKNEVPRAKTLIDSKIRISAQKVEARIPELVSIYLRRSPVSDGYMDTWSGRLLRKAAADGAEKQVHAAFSKAMEDLVKAYGAEHAGFWITRASQAIIYLKGELSEEAKGWFAKAKDKAQNFLWDDE